MTFVMIKCGCILRVLRMQELHYVHEELIKQKTIFQSRLQDRDSEINRLRNQVSYLVSYLDCQYNHHRNTAEPGFLQSWWACVLCFMSKTF